MLRSARARAPRRPEAFQLRLEDAPRLERISALQMRIDAVMAASRRPIRAPPRARRAQSAQDWPWGA